MEKNNNIYSFRFIAQLPPLEEVTTKPRKSCIPSKSKKAPKVTLVLDLDETLVHCSTEQLSGAHLVFPVTFNNVEYKV